MKLSFHMKRIAELTECLRWYVENDDTNEGGKWNESNAHWIAGKRRAQRALGMEQECLDAEACRALGVDRQGSVGSWGHGSEAAALVAALENGGGEA